MFDALVSPEILAFIPENAEKINAGKRAKNHTMPQNEINHLLLKGALEGKQVVRLKGGDPFVFGRGGEELELLAENGIAFEVVPGITSAIAVPAYAGIPVTHRSMVSSFHIITGHAMQGKEHWIDYDALVKTGGTLIFLMGTSSVETICEKLLEAGMDREMPAALISKGTLAGQKKVTAAISTLARAAAAEKIETPAVIIIGEVCSLADSYAWAEKRPLGGKSILITRPADRSSAMAETLRFLGAQVIEMPSIETKKLKNNQKLKTVMEQLCEMGQLCQTRQLCEVGQRCETGPEKWIVFTSPSGVTIFFEQLREWKLDLRRLCFSQIHIAVLGSGTAKELAKHGFFADLMPEEYSAAALGKLLAETQKKCYCHYYCHAATASKIYIIRAKEGSEDLVQPLQKEGIAYEDIPLYETVFVQNQILAEKVKEMIYKEELDFAAFTSASTVRGFLKAIGFDREEQENRKEQDIEKLKFYAVCIGRKTAEEAKKYGMKVLMPQEASIDSMIKLLCLYAD